MAGKRVIAARAAAGREEWRFGKRREVVAREKHVAPRWVRAHWPRRNRPVAGNGNPSDALASTDALGLPAGRPLIMERLINRRLSILCANTIPARWRPAGQVCFRPPSIRVDDAKFLVEAMIPSGR